METILKSHTTRSAKVSLCNKNFKYLMLISYLIGTLLRQYKKNNFKKSQNSHGSTQKNRFRSKRSYSVFRSMF